MHVCVCVGEDPAARPGCTLMEKAHRLCGACLLQLSTCWCRLLGPLVREVVVNAASIRWSLGSRDFTGDPSCFPDLGQLPERQRS